jgi:glycosyltransferase involved in cell wall biosynthesis
MIFFVSTSLSTFVRKDIAILEGIDEVRYFNFNPSRKQYMPFVMVAQAMSILWNIRHIKLFVCMFAAYHSIIPALFSRVFGIPLIVFVGGVDAVAYPSFRFGYFQHRLIRPFVEWTFRWASVISAKDESLWWFEDGYYGKDFPFQGIDYFMPGLKAVKNVMYNGYDEKKWDYSGAKKKNSFVTVAHGWQYESTLMRKGIDLILAVAPLFPNCSFEIIGVDREGILVQVPENVKITGFVENQHLAAHIGSAEFYLQLSITEGFPNALCEAMLCRCIPVVSDVAAMPKIVGVSGFILKKREVELLERVIKEALSLGDIERKQLGMQARERILHYFPIERRAKELKELVLKTCPAYQQTQ